jgi:hypothetical protein
MGAVSGFTQRAVFGPFHRLFSDTQTDETLLKQVRSGELWGFPRQHSTLMSARAYTGFLPNDARGVEFWSFQPPTRTGAGKAFWDEVGPYVEQDDSADKTTVRVAVTRAREHDE